MSKKGLNRRQFLQTSSLAAAGVAATASGAVLLAPDGAWALQLGMLDEHTARTLLVMTRRIYPHKSLDDMYYVPVVEALDGGAKADKDVGKLLTEGVAGLDSAMNIKWLDLSEGNQMKILTGIQDGAFFQKVRGQAVVALYNNPLVWRHFGYEGSSYEYGGYINRGFDDLNWLPQPPDDASPKAG
ncbi:MAG: twin-arginine translocation signal domain-containing protein [Alphaproteobacteria bacterium]